MAEASAGGSGASKFLGSTIGEAGAFAAGLAIAPLLEPILRSLRNETWSEYPTAPIGAETLAEAVAHGKLSQKLGRDEAQLTGISNARFDQLVKFIEHAPALAEGYDLRRRGLITDDDLNTIFQQAGLLPSWWDDLRQLQHELLSPADVAAAIHRGLIPDPGLLKGEQPSGPRNVEAYPVYPIDADAEAAAGGFDHERLGVLVGLQGLPMGVIEAAQAYYRGILTHGDYIAAFNESNNRNEWAASVLEYARQIPTARDFIENALRGYRTFEQAAEGAARHGMSAEDARIIFQNSGRALNLHQITQALAYGASYNPLPGDDPDPYVQSTLIGPIQPAFYEMNEALKYTLPSALYFRTLQQSGVLSEAEAETWYLRLGWPPELAKQVAAAFAKARTSASKEATATDLFTLMDAGRATQAETTAALEALGYPADEAATKVSAHTAKAVVTERNRVLTATHKAYIGGTLDGQAVLHRLSLLGYDDATAAEIARLWGIEAGVLA